MIDDGFRGLMRRLAWLGFPLVYGPLAVAAESLRPARGQAARIASRGARRRARLLFRPTLGEKQAMTQRALEELSKQESLVLLASARVGRLVYVDEQGPVAIPVNYALAGDDVVLRVEQGTKRLALQQPRVAFEVDHIDETAQSAWSVIVRGAAHEVDPDHVPELLRSMGGHAPAPWALGIHNVWIRIVASGMTGRRLGAAASAPLV